MDTLSYFAFCFTSLITIVNPLSAAFVFVSITHHDSHAKKMAMIKRACKMAALILVVFALAGRWILEFFSITSEAFLIVGGMLLIRVGLRMLSSPEGNHEQDPKLRKEAILKEDISLVPLTIPMLSGPGAMATSILLMSQAENSMMLLALIVSILLVCLIAYVALSHSQLIVHRLGENGVNAVNKIMAVIVLVIGVQFILDGITTLASGWFM